jgi:hypothetical protein
MKNVHLDSFEEMSDYLRNNKESFFGLIIEGVKQCIEDGIEFIDIIHFFVKDTKIVIQVKKDDWNTTLLLALEYFESVEDYEKCIEIKNLINNIK